MSLFSANDFRSLKEAMRNHEELSLTRTKRGVTGTATTCRVRPPWDVDMVIQIRLDPLERAIELIQQNSRHYAKRQMTWWRKQFRN